MYPCMCTLPAKFAKLIDRVEQRSEDVCLVAVDAALKLGLSAGAG